MTENYDLTHCPDCLKRGDVMHTYLDTETGEILTQKDLYDEFVKLQAEQPDTYTYSFAQYLRNCLSKNGTLKEV